MSLKSTVIIDPAIRWLVQSTSQNESTGTSTASDDTYRTSFPFQSRDKGRETCKFFPGTFRFGDHWRWYLGRPVMFLQNHDFTSCRFDET